KLSDSGSQIARATLSAWLHLGASGHAWIAIGRPFGGCFEPSATRSSMRPLARGHSLPARRRCTELANTRCAAVGDSRPALVSRRSFALVRRQELFRSYERSSGPAHSRALTPR